MINRTPVNIIPCDKKTSGISRGRVIYLGKEGSRSRGGELFRINKILGEGGSCVCYEATLLGENKTGRLKEFYPTECAANAPRFSLIRDGENHVVATRETAEAFLAARTEFVRSYRILRDVIEKNKGNSGFTSFIPDFSIYYATDADGNFIEGSTAYIWTAPENLTVFDRYIETANKHPGVNTEQQLFNILKTVLTLTECVKIMHDNGLLHLDIKPTNFGIPKRKDKLLTDSITLFDVNSIYSLGGGCISGFGTEGFSAPEVVSGGADNTSDIYSIGCTLFTALAVGGGERLVGYRKEYYPRLSELLDSSGLLSMADQDYAAPLKLALLDILKKCLSASQSKRYQSSVDLAADLEKALAYLYPAVINSRLPLGQRLVLLENASSRREASDPYLRFMYHLYKHPLYEQVDDGGDTLDVLIIGFSRYGQRFLDCCLQLGQMLGRRLNVKVVTDGDEGSLSGKELYLSERPALPDFFSIDGAEVDEAYGYITFEPHRFVKGDLKGNRAIASEISRKYTEGDYVFIDLGDDRLNKSIAREIYSAEDGGRRSVNYAYDGEAFSGKTYGTPLYTSLDFTGEPLFKEIERMAFNAHLVYETGNKVDIKRSRVKFKRPYNYQASVSNVIAIKYKLRDFGISMDDLDAAAYRYYTEVVFGAKGKKNSLIALEHRRWVTEKICFGWVCNSDLASVAVGETVDERAKRHICLVKSTSQSPLKNTKVWTREKWDTAKAVEISTLDPLDSMSVRLHQAYKSEADRLRRESTLFDSSMIQLERIARKSKTASIAFSEWYSCLLLLWNGNDESVREYEGLKDSILDSLSQLDANDYDTARTVIKLVDRRFEPIFRSLKYTNYKSHDAALVNFIPFILTRKENLHLVIPFSTGSNTEMFSNVCAATVANPSEITYLYYLEQADELRAFSRTVDYVLNYMKEKTLSTRISFVIIHGGDARLADAVSEIKTKLASANDEKRIKRITVRAVEDEFSVAGAIFSIFASGLSFDAAERNRTELSSLLVGAGFYDKYPRYQFDMNSRKFYNTVGCEFLKYIKSEQYLKVSDMFASKNSKGYMESPVAFYNDYEALWKRAYRNQEYIWKKMCGLLDEYHESADKVFTVNLDVARDKNLYKKYRYIVPSIAFDGVRKLISFFTDSGIFSRESEVYYYTADSCEVNIYAPAAIEGKLDMLMADRYLLSQPEGIELVKMPYSVSVCFDRLTVTDLDISTVGKHSERVKSLLKMLERDFSFINGYTENGADGQRISFNYATSRIKKLMTVAGNILEIYIYHKCLKSDLFDDVATSYEISWDDTQVKSEFDIILTKGFAGLLVEAKATSDINQEYYFKLSSLAGQFCTNCKPVLVDDTVEDGRNDNSKNDIQRLRGKMMDVITVSDPDEIDSIDVTLSRILSGEYDGGAGADASQSHSAEVTDSSRSGDSAAANTNSEEAKRAYLAEKVSVLHIDQSLMTLLQNNGVKTVGDFLRQTEESFSLMRLKNGMAFTSRFLQLQESIRIKLDKM